MRDELPAADDPSLEGAKDCEDRYDEAIELLAATSNGELERDGSKNGEPKEDSDVVGVPQSGMNDRSHSPHMTAAVAAAALQQSEVPIDGEVATLARTASMTYKSNDFAKSQQVAAVVDDNREWEIRDIIGKEDVDGVPHDLVEWHATLVPKYELKKARALVDKFEARLRAQGRQRDGKVPGRLPQSKAGQQVVVRADTMSRTQQMERRGRPRKQV